MPSQAPRPSEVTQSQLVLDAGNTHSAEGSPWHVPAHVPVPAHGARLPWGGPAGTGVHWPTFPPTSQAWHGRVHAVLQQTPSTQ